jgi:ABC-type sugar transport system ATPase subunit
MLPIIAEGICISRNGQPLFHDFNFDTQLYRRIAIMGSTGAGKTTLLKMLAGLLQPEAGKIFVGRDRVMGPNEKLIAGHPLIGYLSQHYELRNNYYVRELLEMANKEDATRIEEVSALCNIQHLLKRRTDALSGGERQRIALARVLLANPRWLLLDEPYSNLDLNQKRMMMQVIDDVGKHLDLSLIMVSHDATDMLSWAEDLKIIEEGSVVQKGEPFNVYHHPINLQVAGLLGGYNLFEAHIIEQLTNNASGFTNGKKYMIRPEHIDIVQEQTSATAVIQAIEFKGGYRLVHCKINPDAANIVILASSIQTLTAGTQVFLSVLPKYCVEMG